VECSARMAMTILQLLDQHSMHHPIAGPRRAGSLGTKESRLERMFAKIPGRTPGGRTPLATISLFPRSSWRLAPRIPAGKNIRVADNLLQKQQKQRGPPFNGAN